jgi:hypothetical protein
MMDFIHNAKLDCSSISTFLLLANKEILFTPMCLKQTGKHQVLTNQTS